ncbi:MAG: hypothetical protein N3I35_18150 [Clostridia bacterium]|nr:hypothetical protein [Clostridia bacterium]
MLKDYTRGALKVLSDYSISMLFFAVFFLIFYKYLFVYSLVIFFLMVSFLYSGMRKLALKERKPQYKINHFPIKGIIYGVLGFLPVIIATLVIPIIPLQLEAFDMQRLKHVAVNTLLSPLYWVIKLGNEKSYVYLLSYLVVPVISLFGYLAGYYGFELRKFLGGGIRDSREGS